MASLAGILAMVAGLLGGGTAHANYQSDLIKSKRVSHAAQNSQWTLADWLAQKRQTSLMDQWLAMRQSTQWFEWMASAEVDQFHRLSTTLAGTASSHPSGQDYNLDLYLAFLNLSGQYQLTSDRQESYYGAAGLRLLGTSARTTSLVARYGMRQLTDLTSHERVQNFYTEGLLQLYIFSNFGVTGSYAYLFPATSNQNNRWLGSKWTAGGFFEVSLIRLYADYFQTPTQVTATAGTVTDIQVDGFEGGLKLFF